MTTTQIVALLIGVVLGHITALWIISKWGNPFDYLEYLWRKYSK